MVWGRGMKRRLKPLENTPGVYSFFQEIFAPLENLHGQKIVNKIFYHHSIKKLIVNKIFIIVLIVNKVFSSNKKHPFITGALTNLSKFRQFYLIFIKISSFLSIFSLKFTQIYLKFINFIQIYSNFIIFYCFFNVFNH